MTKVDGRQSPAIDKLNVPNSSITKGALQGKGRFGDILEGSVTGELNFIIIVFFFVSIKIKQFNWMWQVWVQQKAALVFYSGYWVLETRTWTLNSADRWICSIESVTPIWRPCWAAVGTRPTFKWFSWNTTRTSIWNRICCRLLLPLSCRGRSPKFKAPQFRSLEEWTH